MRRRTRLALASTASAALALSAAPAIAAGLADPIPAPIPPSQVRVALTTVAHGMTAPIGGSSAPGDRKRLYVYDQDGQVYLLGRARSDGTRPRRLVADLRNLLVENLGGVIPGLAYDERGLLGLAFRPDFRHSHKAYTFGNEDVKAPADFSTLPSSKDADSQLVLREWRVRHPYSKHPTFAMSGRSGRVLLRIDKPQFNHNGGDLGFGPGGMLYLSVGDGGNADDQGDGHVAGGNAQSLAKGNVLGKILRINVKGHNSANGRYGVPHRNPFVGKAGANEIWALGFRNPYRFSIDSRNGRLIVADVGQNDIEEVDVIRRGRNYGWPVKEGTFLFDPSAVDAPGFVTANSPGKPEGLKDPRAQYDHTAPGGVRCGADGATTDACNGIAIVGGYTYHGKAMPRLRGAYIAGDYSQGFAQALGRLWIVRHGTVRALRVAGMDAPGMAGMAVNGFARDGAGELYVLGNQTGVLQGHTGSVVKIVPAGSRG
jgi:glucose/arabinose dehydrogenase